MAEVSWAIKIGSVASPTDFTSVCAGINIKQHAPFMGHKSGRAQITLNNFDGDLTPGAGGTYSGTDWFEQAVFISATSGTFTAQVFHGIIDDFVVNDNGTYSTVTIKASDWFSLFGRSVSEYDIKLIHDEWYKNLQTTCAEYVTGTSGLDLPALGEARGRLEYDTLSFTTRTFDPDLAGSNLEWEVSTVAGTSFADYLKPGYLAAVPSAMWATTIEQDSVTFGGTAVYHMGLIGDELTRSDSAASTFRFADATATGAGIFPINEMKKGFNNDNLVNHIRATVTWTSGGSTNTSTINKGNQTSVDKYGKRSLLNDEAGFYQGNTSGAMSDTLANLVGRMSEVTYEPEQITVKLSSVVAEQSGAKVIVGYLLDVLRGMWQACKIQYTPTGGTLTTTASVIVGRTISATPQDTTITLDLLPAVNYQSFTLNSDILGVLGGLLNVTTYDDSGTTYDDATEPYNGSGTEIHGNRLG
jgi:hypothetical protein